ncbi:MAG: zinc-ribbon domain-containing protein [Candidatus Altiarchaeales archaeon]|nr:zinc-ribbon domain-containing protein [Candidatus Altiarchaeales archaeon]
MKKIIMIFLVLVLQQASAQATLEYAHHRSIAEDISASLAEAGITDSYVNVTEDSVVVHYHQPKIKSDVDVLLVWNYIWATCALYHPESSEIRILQYFDSVPLAEAVVDTTQAVDYVAGKKTFNEFRRSVTVNPPPDRRYPEAVKEGGDLDFALIGIAGFMLFLVVVLGVFFFKRKSGETKNKQKAKPVEPRKPPERGVGGHKFCTECGTKLSREARFCTECGIKQD